MKDRIDVPLSRAMTGSIVVKVRVTGVKRFKIRTAIVSALLRVASWIAPFTVEVETED